MSKAFVNEDAANEEVDFDGEEESDEAAAIPKGKKNYITSKGLERLKALSEPEPALV